MTLLNQRKFIDQIETLPPLPRIVGRILEATKSPDTSADDLAKVLSEDQAMAAKILRVANSPFYGARRRVTQLTRAVVMLGRVAVRNQIIGLCTRSAIAPKEGSSEEHETLWRHSLAVASASELISRRVGFEPPVDAFVAGLLHDIGQLAMVVFQPGPFREVLQNCDRDAGLLELERQHLGIDHTEAGSRILTRWGLPEAVCRVAEHHHDPDFDQADDHARLLAIVMLADTLAQVMGMGFAFHLDLAHRSEAATRFLETTETDQLFVLDRLEERVTSTDGMLAAADAILDLGGPGSARTALWITNGAGGAGMGKVLLQHFGYDVQERSVSGGVDVPPETMVFVCLPEGERVMAARLAGRLARDGQRKIVLVSDASDGGPARRRNDRTGVLMIPRSFTAFDLQWVEEQLAPRNRDDAGEKGPQVGPRPGGGRPDGGQGPAG